MSGRVWLAGFVTAALMMCADASAAGVVTFNRDVLPILQPNCQTCHPPGNIAPKSLLYFSEDRQAAKIL